MCVGSEVRKLLFVFLQATAAGLFFTFVPSLKGSKTVGEPALTAGDREPFLQVQWKLGACSYARRLRQHIFRRAGLKMELASGIAVLSR